MVSPYLSCNCDFVVHSVMILNRYSLFPVQEQVQKMVKFSIKENTEVLLKRENDLKANVR